MLVPSSGEGRPVPPAAHLPTLHVVERYGLVWVCPGEPVARIPVIEADDDPAYRRINTGVEHLAVVGRADDRQLPRHLPLPVRAHRTFGIESNTLVPKIELEQLDDDFYGYDYTVQVGNEAGAASSGIDADVVDAADDDGLQPAVHRAQHDPLPHRSRPPDPALLDAGRRRHVAFTFVIWRNDDHSVPAEEVIAFDRAIGAEDKLMLERVPGVLPLDPQATVSVQSDRPSVEWRRRLSTALTGEHYHRLMVRPSDDFTLRSSSSNRR